MPLVFAALLLLAVPGVGLTLTFDHLKCYKIRDSLAGRYAVTMTDQFAAEGCTLGKAQLFCAAAEKTGVVPQPPGGGPPPRPATDVVCYKARCRNYPTDLVVEDQFGRRTLRFRSARLICAPAVTNPPLTTTTSSSLPPTTSTTVATTTSTSSSSSSTSSTSTSATTSSSSSQTTTSSSSTTTTTLIGCLPAGADCAQSSDCCEGVCEAGVCTPPCCDANGTACTNGSTCCTDVCQTSGTPSTSVCACVDLDGICIEDRNCCSGRCSGGFCAPRVCQPSGACTVAGDCCTNTCAGGFCSCIPDSGTCSDDRNCCSGLCSAGACARANCCMPNGASCINGSTCCTDVCQTSGTPSTSLCACVPMNGICIEDRNCCSGACTAGLCE